MKLLTESSGNAKTHKTDLKHEGKYRIVSLALSPTDSAGDDLPTNCPSSSAGCRAACVGGPTVGLASVWKQIMEGRIRKTHYLREDRPGFLRQLIGELQTEQRNADRDGQTLAVRLNTFSDLPWETGAFGRIPQQFPNARFYDYTAILKRSVSWNLPANYSLCLSRKEDTPDATLLETLTCGRNVSVVFAHEGSYSGRTAMNQVLPRTWLIGGHRFQVFDGDVSDLRFLDPGPTNTGRGRICGLRLKAGSNDAHQRAIDSGFAVLVK